MLSLGVLPTFEGVTTLPSYECIKVETVERVTTVSFNRPEKRNAMNPALITEMLDALTRLARDPETEVLVLTGAGESFSAGMDLQQYFRDTDDDLVLQERVRWEMREWAYTKLRFFPRVTVAAVNGWCFGGAFMPLISCDLAIAADEAQFGLSEVNWGILPGGTVTRDIALALGYRDAMHYALTGDIFDGRQAAAMGLVNSSVPREELPAALSELTSEAPQAQPRDAALDQGDLPARGADGL